MPEPMRALAVLADDADRPAVETVTLRRDVFDRLMAAEAVCFAMSEWIPDRAYADPLQEHRLREAVLEAYVAWRVRAQVAVLAGEAIA